MQEQPLLISTLIEFADKHHGDGEVVSRRVEGDIHRYTWSDVARRSRQVANALDGMKLGFSDRVATIAWNGYRHLELYFGVSGSGRVLHTINPRLHPEQIAWIANHAEDQVLCFDMTFLPIVQAIHSKCASVKHWVAMCDADKLPADTGIPNLTLVKDKDGQNWFPTGDVATIDADGFMQITDRSKDVIKSGGEWISSIDIENIAVAHPAVAMAACIGVAHPKWDERPIVAVVKKPDAQVSREELLAFYEGKTAKWQIPDDVVFVDAIPIGATGKMLKTKLRELLKDYKLPTV
jgi:acyl-CoA synthetase (AMP-forming)/AMP-acid ligase II